MYIKRISPFYGTKNFYMDNVLESNLRFLKDCVLHHNTSCVIIIDGESGKGKTTLANQIGIYLNPLYNLNNLYYTFESFLNGLANAQKGEVLVFDEAMLLTGRASMSEFNRTIMQAMSMIRSKNIFIIFNITAIFDIDRNLALSRTQMLINVHGATLIDRGNFSLYFKDSSGRNRLKDLYIKGKKDYDYNVIRPNYPHGRFNQEFIIDPITYEVKKQAMINAFMSRTKELDSVQARLNGQRNNLVCWLYENKCPISSIAIQLDVGEPAVRNIIAKYWKAYVLFRRGKRDLLLKPWTSHEKSQLYKKVAAVENIVLTEQNQNRLNLESKWEPPSRRQKPPGSLEASS